MAQSVTTAKKAQVVRSGRSQSIRLPAAFRFSTDEVYIRRDQTSGVVTLSETPLKPSLQEVFAEFDAIGLDDFEIARDRSQPREIDL